MQAYEEEFGRFVAREQEMLGYVIVWLMCDMTHSYVPGLVRMGHGTYERVMARVNESMGASSTNHRTVFDGKRSNKLWTIQRTHDNNWMLHDQHD